MSFFGGESKMNDFNLKIQLLSQIGMTRRGVVYAARILSVRRNVMGYSMPCPNHAHEIQVVLSNAMVHRIREEGYSPLAVLSIEAYETQYHGYGTVMEAYCLDDIEIVRESVEVSA